MINGKIINNSSLLYGSGFALNVYLPALIELGIKNIFINKKYFYNETKSKIIDKYNKHITIIDEKDHKDKFFNYTVLAISPSEQYDLIFNNDFLRNTNTLILEKPLAVSPKDALKIVRELEEVKVNYLINYAFRYALWYKELSSKLKSLPNNIDLFFTWTFMSRHFIHKRKTWKRYHSKGGGALRFYGIHLVAILSDIGYSEIKEVKNLLSRNDELSSFECTFHATNNLPNCKVIINSHSLEKQFSCFSVNDNKKNTLLDIEEPFPRKDEDIFRDPRIDLTRKFISANDFSHNDLNVIKLWKAIEDKM